MITTAEKAALLAKGYTIEDMDEAWGPGWWEGQFRFIRDDTEDFGVPQYTVEAAWEDAKQFDALLTAIGETA